MSEGFCQRGSHIPPVRILLRAPPLVRLVRFRNYARRLNRVTLDIATAYALMVLQLPTYCTKCVAYRDIRVFVTMTRVMLVLHIELSSRGRYLDADFIDMALTTMFVRQFDDHLATNHLAAELLEALCQFAYARFKSVRRLDAAPSDLNRDRHDFVLSMLNGQR